MKARDIVPGWPRSRSTLPSWENSKWEYCDCWINFIRVDIFSSAEAFEARDLHRLDDLRDKLYHAEQHEMLWRYFEDRLGVPRPQRDFFNEALRAWLFTSNTSR